MTDEKDKYYDHVRQASQEASKDFDTMTAKLGTAGLTVAVAVAGLTDAEGWGFLIASGVTFALALTASLLSIRLSADGLRTLASGRRTYNEIRQFKGVRWLNWVSFVLLSSAFVLLSLHLLDATVQTG